MFSSAASSIQRSCARRTPVEPLNRQAKAATETRRLTTSRTGASASAERQNPSGIGGSGGSEPWPLAVRRLDPPRDGEEHQDDQARGTEREPGGPPPARRRQPPVREEQQDEQRKQVEKRAQSRPGVDRGGGERPGAVVAGQRQHRVGAGQTVQGGHGPAADQQPGHEVARQPHRQHGSRDREGSTGHRRGPHGPVQRLRPDHRPGRHVGPGGGHAGHDAQHGQPHRPRRDPPIRGDTRGIDRRRSAIRCGRGPVRRGRGRRGRGRTRRELSGTVIPLPVEHPRRNTCWSRGRIRDSSA